MVYACVSLLDEEHNARIAKVWAGLRRRFGVSYVSTELHIPHISHHVVEEYDVPRLSQRMKELSTTQTTIRVRTAGLGLFGGEEPALYIGVVRNTALSELHQRVWDVVRDLGDEPTGYYQPERWVPHITLAQYDIDRDNIGEVMAYLSQYQFAWDIPVTKLALIEHNDQPTRLLEQYDLQRQT